MHFAARKTGAPVFILSHVIETEARFLSHARRFLSIASCLTLDCLKYVMIQWLASADIGVVRPEATLDRSLFFSRQAGYDALESHADPCSFPGA